MPHHAAVRTRLEGRRADQSCLNCKTLFPRMIVLHRHRCAFRKKNCSTAPFTHRDSRRVHLHYLWHPRWFGSFQRLFFSFYVCNVIALVRIVFIHNTHSVIFYMFSFAIRCSLNDRIIATTTSPPQVFSVFRARLRRVSDGHFCGNYRGQRWPVFSRRVRSHAVRMLSLPPLLVFQVFDSSKH